VQPNGDLTVIFQSIDHLTTVAQTSTDGGVTWGPQVTVAKFDGADPTGIRSGALPAAAVDPLTGDLYAAWQDLRFRTDGLNDILLSTSTDGGTTWTTPIRVNQDATDSKIDHFTPAVAAYGGSVFVTYRTRDNSAGLSNKVGMAIIVSTDGGATFSGELAMGPPTSLRYAAYVNGDVAEGADVPGIHHPDAPAIQKFLGDYMGLSATATAVQAVWCVASTPPTGETLFQTAWSGTLTSR
jgi:hypothetical protein